MENIPKSTFVLLEAKIEKAQAELDKLQTAYTNLQDTCQHDYQYTGSTHNDSVYQCTVCNKVEYR